MPKFFTMQGIMSVGGEVISTGYKNCPLEKPKNDTFVCVQSPEIHTENAHKPQIAKCFPNPSVFSGHIPQSSCQALRHAVASLHRLDDFTCEKIGSGFFSEVFKVTHRTTNHVMVLKMNTSFSNRSNMLREVQLMNRLSHPNILRFMGVCVHEGQLHALTEYINGGSLEQLLLDKEEDLPWSVRLSLSVDIARGMSYLHSRGVFHRDLTSKNVLIKKAGAKMMSVVGDFGLAEKIPDPRDRSHRLPVVGSPYWMAPECLRGEWYNEKADVFSFGIIQCEIIARIEADPDILPRTENFGVDYVSFSDMCPDCPPQFLKQAFSCCRIDPRSRPSFKESYNYLENLRKDLFEPVEKNGSLVCIEEPSDVNADTTENVNAIFVQRWKSQKELKIPVKDPEDYPPDENSWQPPLTPKHVGEVMSLGDPHYKPNNSSHNPFATLTHLKDGKKLLGLSVNDTIMDVSPTCSFDLPSPSCAPTPPATPITPEDLCAHNSGNTLSVKKHSSHSLPASPTLLRRTLVRMHSVKSDLCPDTNSISPRSISPEPSHGCTLSIDMSLLSAKSRGRSAFTQHQHFNSAPYFDSPSEPNPFQPSSSVSAKVRHSSGESGIYSASEHVFEGDLSPEPKDSVQCVHSCVQRAIINMSDGGNNIGVNALEKASHSNNCTRKRPSSCHSDDWNCFCHLSASLSANCTCGQTDKIVNTSNVQSEPSASKPSCFRAPWDVVRPISPAKVGQEVFDVPIEENIAKSEGNEQCSATPSSSHSQSLKEDAASQLSETQSNQPSSRRRNVKYLRKMESL